jgi:hypothetical protein
MSMTLNTLTEGIRQRHMGTTHKRLTEKWNRTGLLRGLQGYNRENMAVLLENQAAQVLKESNSLGNTGANSTGPGSTSSIAGFQNVAFPIVRRVFGGLVANELVSIQPMSLPAGLLFYLDYTYGTEVGGDDAASGASTYSAGGSIYNNPVGRGIQSGSTMTGGQYDLLGSGYSRRHDTTAAKTFPALSDLSDDLFFAEVSAAGVVTQNNNPAAITTASDLAANTTASLLVDHDADLSAKITSGVVSGLSFLFVKNSLLIGEGTGGWDADLTMLQDIVAHTQAAMAADATAVPADVQPGTGLLNLRRYTKRVRFTSDVSGTGRIVVDPLGGTHVMLVINGAGPEATATSSSVKFGFVASPERITQGNGDSTVIPTFESTFDSNEPDAAPIIPEIDIKIESLSVVATSRKLKAKWSPELAQDLNAYHSLDAEQELTQILSEQIALELDREILNDLLTQANGANLFWSRAPGKFVNKLTGAVIARGADGAGHPLPGPTFTGTVQDWYSTLVETIIDAGNIIQRKTLRGSANFIVVGTDVATVLESSVMYKSNYSIDGQGQVGAISVGAEKIGSLSNRFTVYKDPYFPRNRILIGYKGGSYLETGYVYAPYVPLIVTPTMFAPEDFTPRKGVMTRYGKKMVRSDFYGTVTCLDMHII